MNATKPLYNFPVEALANGFISPSDQCEKFVDVVLARGVTRKMDMELINISKLPDPPPWPESPTAAVVLETTTFKLPDAALLDTLNFVSLCCAQAGMSLVGYTDISPDPLHVRLTDGTPHVVGARYVIVEFNAHRSAVRSDVGGAMRRIPPHKRLGYGLIQSLAYFPKFFAQNEHLVSGFWASAFEFSPLQNSQFDARLLTRIRQGRFELDVVCPTSVPSAERDKTSIPLIIS